ncbi:hypothetical protein PBOR_33190 [Paenibacillus borealis]|uniref:Uncharacterized protein n=1 Tax=Paenibacillus borealis TaxID=160799 RepID=A0A089LM96_PAEBO|nr:hypothetical protein PBOR_33190 [Paenibacillus borealis]
MLLFFFYIAILQCTKYRPAVINHIFSMILHYPQALSLTEKNAPLPTGNRDVLRTSYFYAKNKL